MLKIKKMAIVTDKIELNNNHLPDGKFQLNTKITRNIGKISENVFFTQLSVEIKNEDNFKFPINLSVVIKGIFDFEEAMNELEVNAFLKHQAVNILYPYIRSMVTSTTTNAMMAPVVLPIIDAIHLFPEDKSVNHLVS